MSIILSFINQKGGTGKTTLSVNTSYYISTQKKRVLLIDLDPQGHAAKCLGVYETGKYNSGDLFNTHSLSPFECRKNLWILPSDSKISKKAIYAKKDALRTNIKQLTERLSIDIVVIDSPPSMDHITESILVSSDYVAIPVSINYLALEGCAGLLNTIDELKEKHGLDRPDVAIIIPTFYRNTKLAKEILSTLRKHFKSLVAKTVVGLNVKIDEAQSFGKSVLEYAPSSRGALYMKRISNELIKKIL